MAALDWESWWRLPNLWARAGHSCREGPDGRRPGDQEYRGHLESQAEARVRGSRPRSCIEGTAGGLEGWLQPPEREKTKSASQLLSEKTASMPALEVNDIHCRHLRPDSAPGAWSITTHQPRNAPQGDTELPSPGWRRRNSEPSGRWETARLKDLPSGMTARPCSMAAVKSGWLPSQRRAAVCSVPSRPGPAEEPRFWATLNPGTSTGFPEDLPRKNGFGHRGGEMVGSSPRWRGPAASPGLPPGRTEQVWEGTSVSAESHFPRGLEGLLNAQERIRHGAPLRAGQAALPVSAAGRGAVSAPPAVGTADRPKLRSGFSSITIASRKVPPSTGMGQPLVSGGSTPTAPPSDAPADTPGQPATRQRKATVIRVTGRRQSLPAGQPLAAGCLPTFRHSHAMWADEQNDSPPRRGLRADDPPEALGQPARTALFLSNPDVSQEARPKVHRSTLSLYLKSPFCRGSALEGKETEARVRPRRPLSFAGADGLSGAGPYEAETLHPRRASLQLPGCRDPAEKAAAEARDRGTYQSPDVAAKAAAVIANIKRQCQLRKVVAGPEAQGPQASQRSSCTLGLGSPGADRCGPGLEVEDAGRDWETEGVPVQSHADLLDGPQENLTLQEALQRFRPDFIRRSRGRQKELEQRAQERRAQQGPDPAPASGRGRPRASPLRNNPRKPRQGAIGGEKVPHACRRNDRRPSDMKKKGEEEEKKRAMTQTNRLRAEIFKKKLLDQILRRKSD